MIQGSMIHRGQSRPQEGLPFRCRALFELIISIERAADAKLR